MISTAKIFNNLNSTRSETFHNSLTHPFAPSPTNGLSLPPTQLRSLQSNLFFFSICRFFTLCKTSSIVEDVYIDRNRRTRIKTARPRGRKRKEKKKEIKIRRTIYHYKISFLTKLYYSHYRGSIDLFDYDIV